MVPLEMRAWNPLAGAAGNGDECKGKYLSGKDRSRSVDEACEWRHVQGGPHGYDAKREQCDRAKFDERAEVIARCEQQPDRQC